MDPLTQTSQAMQLLRVKLDKVDSPVGSLIVVENFELGEKYWVESAVCVVTGVDGSKILPLCASFRWGKQTLPLYTDPNWKANTTSRV